MRHLFQGLNLAKKGCIAIFIPMGLKMSNFSLIFVEECITYHTSFLYNQNSIAIKFESQIYKFYLIVSRTRGSLQALWLLTSSMHDCQCPQKSLSIIGLFLQWNASSGGKVQFSSVQRTISLNLELNSRFSSGHSAKP